ncbi:MAG: SCO family protein [Pseudomonadota bacterium]
MNTRLILPVLCGAAALVLGIVLSQMLSSDKEEVPTSTSATIEGLFWPQTRDLPTFDLLDQNAQAFTRDNFKGKWSLVFFGYTHCPDICPITMSILKAMKDKIADQPEQTDTQYVFVSVDPARDTIDIMKGYVEHFDPTFVGVSGEQTEVAKFTRPLGVVHMQMPGRGDNPEENYLVDHSSALLLINPEAQMIGLISTPHTPQNVADRYLQMRRFVKEHASKARTQNAG